MFLITLFIIIFICECFVQVQTGELGILFHFQRHEHTAFSSKLFLDSPLSEWHLNTLTAPVCSTRGDSSPVAACLGFTEMGVELCNQTHSEESTAFPLALTTHSSIIGKRRVESPLSLSLPVSPFGSLLCISLTPNLYRPNACSRPGWALLYTGLRLGLR